MAGDIEVADAAYKRGAFSTALALLRPLADSGDARAQTTLGAKHAHGQGMLRNDEKAVKLYRLAANQGFARA
jgi:TPR repeat protein